MSFPGAYSASDPGIKINIYSVSHSTAVTVSLADTVLGSEVIHPPWTSCMVRIKLEGILHSMGPQEDSVEIYANIRTSFGQNTLHTQVHIQSSTITI